MKIYTISSIVILMSICFGCKKSDTLDTDMGLTRVKVYDDTLADIRNHSANIAAGTDQLYMTYGVGRVLYSEFLNGLGYSGGFGDFNAKLMATDFDGNLKWIKELPANRMAADILVLDNGDVVVGTFKLDIFSSELNLIRFDKNGEKIVEVTAPISSFTRVENICLIRAFNGNIIVSGAYSGQATKGYVCEYDLNFNQIWYKGFYNVIDRVLATENNNYLFIQESVNDSSIIVLKTNATGDSLWSKPISDNFYQISNSTFFYPGCNDFVKNSNGNYVVSVSSRVSSDYYAEIKSYLYEINANGDLLNTTSSGFLNFNYNAALVSKKDGGVFALMQSYLYDYASSNNSPQVFNDIHSGFASFDAGLSLVSNKQIQSKTSDHLTAACNLPTGEIACFGLIKSEGKIYYKPELIIVK